MSLRKQKRGKGEEKNKKQVRIHTAGGIEVEMGWR